MNQQINIGIVAAEFNYDITFAMVELAKEHRAALGAVESQRRKNAPTPFLRCRASLQRGRNASRVSPPSAGRDGRTGRAVGIGVDQRREHRSDPRDHAGAPRSRPPRLYRRLCAEFWPSDRRHGRPGPRPRRSGHRHRR